METAPLMQLRVRPGAARVAARALALAVVTGRGFAENNEDRAAAEKHRRGVCRWVENIDLWGELEPMEYLPLLVPVGELDDPQVATDAMWRSEGMHILAWALKCAPLPRYDMASAS